MLTSIDDSESNLQKTQPEGTNQTGRPLGHVQSTVEAVYGFGAAAAEAAPAAASAAAPAALAASAAPEAEAADSIAGAMAAGAGAAASDVGAGASVLLPQALSTSAATKALIASLVFIYRYPRNI
jgi:L-fucose isomerase-like protein